MRSTFFRTAVVAVLFPMLVSSQQTNHPKPSTQTPSPASSTVGAATGRHYTNSDGHRVHFPVAPPSAPSGATAKCRDGTYSFSQYRNGTCSHHGGVATWLLN